MYVRMYCIFLLHVFCDVYICEGDFIPTASFPFFSPEGSPLMQCYGLLCIHAHFANCKSRELLWINNSSIHGRKMRSQKKPSPVEPLIAELARCTGEPTQGHRSTLSQLEAHSGSLKSFLEAVGDVTRSSKGSGLPWQKRCV